MARMVPLTEKNWHLLFLMMTLPLQKVNSLVHPEVRNAFIKWTAEQNSDYILHEAAILMESGFYKMMDYTIVVVAVR